MKNIFIKINSIKKGIKFGWNIPTLPPHIIAFTLHPLIRILRVLGGISVLMLLSKKTLLFPTAIQSSVLIICIFISMIYLIYHLYITYHRIRHVRFLFKTRAYEVRNSPLDRFASLASKLLLCVKSSCDTIGPAGSALGIMFGVDTMLESKR